MNAASNLQGRNENFGDEIEEFEDEIATGSEDEIDDADLDEFDEDESNNEANSTSNNQKLNTENQEKYTNLKQVDTSTTNTKSTTKTNSKNNENISSDRLAPKLRVKKKSPNGADEKLDTVRFSMYNIQNSQLNEIDALLNELNQLQNTLDYPDQAAEAYAGGNELVYINVSVQNNAKPINQISKAAAAAADEVEAIDQQFDEVLKFLAQTIDDRAVSPQSSSSPSSMSLTATPNTDNKKSPGEFSSGSSNSSGIDDEFYEHRKKNELKEQKVKQTVEKHFKRNSSDSAYLETVSMPSSLSLAGIGNNHHLHQNLPHPHHPNHNQNLINNQNKMIENQFMANQNVTQNFMNISSSSAGSSEPSPKAPNFEQTETANQQTPEESAEAVKAEKIRIALEKLKEANIKKLIVKAYTDDGCAKSVIIDETMKVYDVMLMLFSKNHTKPAVNYAVVEHLPKFHMERIFEDHENLVEAMSNWSRDSDNQIIFTVKEAKYDLFLKPELYLMNESKSKIEDFQRTKLINEFFQNIGSSVPDIEGPLYLKVESKKSWKKYYCVLRQSGLYFIPKGKNKKDLQCLFNFDKLDLYYGLDWRKEYKAPTDSCFALKYPQVQSKSSKYIKYVCCENERDLKRWFNGIRIAKFGKQLLDNYKKILDLIELNRLTGRLPIASTRRLSTTFTNGASQRPRSSYSIASNNQNEEPNNNNNENASPSHNNRAKLTASSLLMRQDSKSQLSPEGITGSQSSIQSSHHHNHNHHHHHHESSTNLSRAHILNNSSFYGANNSRNASYTEQLKSLLSSHQSSGMTMNHWSPLCVSTQHVAAAAASSSSLVKFPLSTGSVTHLADRKDHRSQPQHAQQMLDSKSAQSLITERQLSKIEFTYENNSCNNVSTTEHFYDLPTPPAIDEFENGANSPTLPSPPHSTIPTNCRLKPAIVKLHRMNSNEQEVSIVKHIEAQQQRFNKGRMTNSAQTSQSPLVVNELSSILARQKKKIEESSGEQASSSISQHNSPKVAKKPPPPPRSDRSQLSRKQSLENAIY